MCLEKHKLPGQFSQQGVRVNAEGPATIRPPDACRVTIIATGLLPSSGRSVSLMVPVSAG